VPGSVFPPAGETIISRYLVPSDLHRKICGVNRSVTRVNPRADPHEPAIPDFKARRVVGRAPAVRAGGFVSIVGKLELPTAGVSFIHRSSISPHPKAIAKKNFCGGSANAA
jgi:hypothetical protein